MAEQLTEQQNHLQSILNQQKELANEINMLQGQLNAKGSCLVRLREW